MSNLDQFSKIQSQSQQNPYYAQHKIIYNHQIDSLSLLLHIIEKTPAYFSTFEITVLV